VFTLALPRFFGFAPAAGDRDGPPARRVRKSDLAAKGNSEVESATHETTIAGRPATELLHALSGTDIQAASQALSDIYLTYFQTLWQFAYRWTRAQDEAEELVQNVFFSLWTRRETLDIGGEIITYLRVAVRNQIYKRARHSAVIGRMERAVEGEITDVPAMGRVVDPETSLDEADIDRLIDKALSTISQRDRDVVTMRFVERMTFDEIASVLGVSKTRVRAILARVTQRLIPVFAKLRRG
jgi:RNA polymerase sigma-70 factor (ECF subfamily)